MKKRNDFLDYLKGIAIILVIIGHCIQYGSGNLYRNDQLYFDNLLFRYIYSFHMPLFMIVSGYLFYYSEKNKSIFTIIKSKIKTILIPLVAFSTIIFVIDLLTDRLLYQFSLIAFVKYIFNNFWFLWAILILSIGIACVNKMGGGYISRINKLNIIYIIIFLLCFITPDIFGIEMYKFTYPFFLGGYLYNKYNYNIFNYLKKNKIQFFLLIFLYVFLLSFYNKNCYIYTTGFTIINKDMNKMIIIDLYRILIGFIGSLVHIIIFKMIYTKLENCKIIKNIGKQTLGIYCISSILFSYLLPLITYNLLKINYVYTIIETLIILICSYVLCIILSKWFVTRFLFLGNRK